jgi:hypothetical protein
MGLALMMSGTDPLPAAQHVVNVSQVTESRKGLLDGNGFSYLSLSWSLNRAQAFEPALIMPWFRETN